MKSSLLKKRKKKGKKRGEKFKSYFFLQNLLPDSKSLAHRHPVSERMPDVSPGGKAFQVALERSCTSSLMFFAQVLQAFAHRSTMCSLARDFRLGKGLQVVAVTLATTEKHMTEVQHTAEPCKKK